ncbi:MAG: Dam family site-specific DNA-(adenine-N6)-methyltransferase, partial [Bacteroidales bacterium]|nr:Dam family site-specific DNA-(adenine-N6)-methyltransferase [Bacteroidales bacterium]
DTYYEPFVGGGAMMPFARTNKGVASDIIPELIELWNAIKVNPQLVANEYQNRWDDLQEKGQEVYYLVRDRFNQTKNCFDFLFLTRTCVNGLIRYNNQGEFNNSFHLSRPGINPATLRSQVLLWSKCIRKFNFHNVDYRECLLGVKADDFVFLDPPYGGTKDRYTRTEFDLNSFYAELERLNSVGAKWLLTFDGTAGEREYSYAPPSDIFKYKFFINTGNSAFTKVMDSKKDVIQESVYMNFNPLHTRTDLFQEFFGEIPARI